MALKDTCNMMHILLNALQEDLIKAENGNKAAAQRVRTASIKLEKTAKLYRKESVKAEKSGSLKRKTATKTTSKKQKTTSSKKVLSNNKKPINSGKKIATKKAPLKHKSMSTKIEKRKSAKR